MPISFEEFDEIYKSIQELRNECATTISEGKSTRVENSETNLKSSFSSSTSFSPEKKITRKVATPTTALSPLKRIASSPAGRRSELPKLQTSTVYSQRFSPAPPKNPQQPVMTPKAQSNVYERLIQSEMIKNSKLNEYRKKMLEEQIRKSTPVINKPGIRKSIDNSSTVKNTDKANGSAKKKEWKKYVTADGYFYFHCKETNGK